jgi:hypothetical protein
MSLLLAHRVISLRCKIWSLLDKSGHRAGVADNAFMMEPARPRGLAEISHKICRTLLRRTEITSPSIIVKHCQLLGNEIPNPLPK